MLTVEALITRYKAQIKVDINAIRFASMKHIEVWLDNVKM